MTQFYEGGFSDWHDVESSFQTNPLPEPKHIYAEYDDGGYDGSAFVVYSYDGVKWYCVEGSHCSCYGLEDQWEPTDHSAEEIERMFYHNKNRNTTDFDIFWNQVKEEERAENL